MHRLPTQHSLTQFNQTFTPPARTLSIDARAFRFGRRSNRTYISAHPHHAWASALPLHHSAASAKRAALRSARSASVARRHVFVTARTWEKFMMSVLIVSVV